MSLAVLITRPEPSALHLADALRARWGCGVRVVISPVLEIKPTGIVPDLDGIGTLIFTSQHAVDAYLATTSRRDLPCYAVGAATAAAAQAAGLDTVHADGNADALIALMLTSAVRGSCLHLRGAHVTGDLAHRLTEQGLPTSETVLYDQVECPLSADAKACLTRGTKVILPLYSPRSAKILFSQVRPEAQLYVAAISDNVAAHVPKDVVKCLLVADQPHADAMIRVLDKLLEDAKRVEGANRAQ